MWFTTYEGDPRGWSRREKYTDLFKMTVQLIREQFMLTKYIPGEDRNTTSFWKEYELQGMKVRIQVTRFQYSEVGSYGWTLSPVFYLNTIIEVYERPGPTFKNESYIGAESFEEVMPWWLTILDAYFPEWPWVKEKASQYRGVRNVRRTRQVRIPGASKRWVRFFEYPIKIVFPENYPHEPPKFRVEGDRFLNQGASHEQHLFSGGWLCILASDSDWNYPKDTVISGFNAALDWAVLHYKNFGW